MTAAANLPGLPPSAAPKQIIETVNALVQDYNSGRIADIADHETRIAALESDVAALDVSVTALQALANSDATTYLASDVVLNNPAAFFNGPNTGSIGAAGQKWLILAGGVIARNNGATSGELAIYDGTTVFTDTTGVAPAATYPATVVVGAVITQTAAKTYTLIAKANMADAVLQTTGASSGATNKATWITAVRLK